MLATVPLGPTTNLCLVRPIPEVPGLIAPVPGAVGTVSVRAPRNLFGRLEVHPRKHAGKLVLKLVDIHASIYSPNTRFCFKNTGKFPDSIDSIWKLPVHSGRKPTGQPSDWTLERIALLN